MSKEKVRGVQKGGEILEHHSCSVSSVDPGGTAALYEGWIQTDWRCKILFFLLQFAGGTGSIADRMCASGLSESAVLVFLFGSAGFGIWNFIGDILRLQQFSQYCIVGISGLAYGSDLPAFVCMGVFFYQQVV